MIEIEKTIQEIEAINLKNDDAIDLLQNLLSNKLKRFPILLTDLKVGEPLIRSRYLNEDEDYHRIIQDYSYHPFPDQTKIGRANLQGQQIFYGSRFRVTSLAEVRFIYANREKEYSRYSLGRWEVTTKLNLAALVIPESIRKHNTRELFELADFIESKEKEYADDPALNDLLSLYRYFAIKFTEAVKEGEEYKYKITALLADFIFSHLPNVDGIIYQSVQYPEHFNVAVRRDVVDQNKLKLIFAARQNFVKVGPLNYREDESINAINIDHNTSIVTWN